MSSFEVKTPLFEGPFDLLLFFIKRDELDIHDIPIFQITKDFLGYLQQLERLNIEVASEFILVAATLIRIKAKMLLPRVEVDDEGNEVDPREDLVRHLLEYKKYKSVVGELGEMEEGELLKEKRGNILKEINAISSISDVETELQDIDLYKLLKVFQKTISRFQAIKNRPTHAVTPFPYNVEDQKQYILDKVDGNGNISFEDLIKEDFNRIAVIFNFLSILELLAANLIDIKVGMGFNNFWITRPNDQELAKKPE